MPSGMYMKERPANSLLHGERLGKAFSEMPDSPPLHGTLVQSVTDPLIFYSFGSWAGLDDINAMSQNERVKKALAGIMSFCQEAKPGNYKKVREVSYPGNRKQ